MNSFIIRFWRDYWAKSKGIFQVSIEEEKKFLNMLPAPKSYIDRSINQYKCQNRLYGRMASVILNFIFSLILPLHMLYMVINSLVKKQEKKECVEAVYLKDLPLTYIPNSVKSEFETIIQVNPNGDMYFSLFDFKYIMKLILKCKYPYFVYKNFLKILNYSAIIREYNPKCIIVSNEFSFTSSVMTHYCKCKNVLHYNVMHGEKLFDIRDSYFAFNKCYIWHEHYKNLFISLNAKKTQFFVEIPDAMKIDIGTELDKKNDFTYYLSAEKEDALSIIRQTLLNLQNAGYKVAVRPHPRYSNMKLVRKYLDKFEIEDYRKINLEESIKKSRCAISLCSTVLLQVALNGGNIIIDDMSDRCAYLQLLDADYICLKLNHKLLSSLQETV